MYKTPQSLAAALRVFVRRGNMFTVYPLLRHLARDGKIISQPEFYQLFDALGERSDCYAQISERRYQWICDPDFFSDDYVISLVCRLGFAENTPERHRHKINLNIKRLPERFTVHDVAKITGESISSVSYYINNVLVKNGLAVVESPKRGYWAAVYRKATAKPNAEPAEPIKPIKPVKPAKPVKPVIEEKKEVKQDRPLANVDLETLLNEISYRGIQWRLYGGPGKQPKV